MQTLWHAKNMNMMSTARNNIDQHNAIHPGVYPQSTMCNTSSERQLSTLPTPVIVTMNCSALAIGALSHTRPKSNTATKESNALTDESETETGIETANDHVANIAYLSTPVMTLHCSTGVF